MELGIENRVALVTGASKGIGKSIALALGQAGCQVIMLSRDEALLKQARDEVAELSACKPVYIVGDVSNEEQVSVVFQQIRRDFGSLDILVNNCSGPAMGCFAEHDKSTWDNAYSTNLYSFINFSTHAAEMMKENKWGRIINVTTYLAKEPVPSMVLSATMRAGVTAFSKCISQELAEFGVTVNTICPSAVLTDRMVDLTNVAAEREGKTYDEILDRAQASIPAKRFSTPEEIADLAAFLASERAGYITGISHLIDGGLSKSIF